MSDAEKSGGKDTRPNEAALVAQNLHKSFVQGEEEIHVLNGASLTVCAGERVAVVGRSGSGKSTLLHVLAGLDDTDEGSILIVGEDMSRADSNKRAEIRRRHMGFVYQAHHLLPEFSAMENVAIPLRLSGEPPSSARDRASAILARVGLGDRVDHKPHALSGGERQRVAVARALAHTPQVVLADEPTGNLDRQNADQVMELLASLSQAQGTAFLVVTHDLSMLEHFDRVLHLEAGVLGAGAD
jgi:lipoprotein-releasing system ATP-binding protein